MFAQRIQHLTSSIIREILASAQKPNVISFAGGLPAEGSFPDIDWSVLPNKVRQYGMSEGEPELREAIAAEARQKGISCDASQVLILSKGHLVAVGAPEQLAEKLNPGSRLRATALGGGKTVLKTVGSIPGIRKVEIESEADGQVTFTAESADASDRRAEVSRALSQAGCTVLALAAENRTLEEVFLALTENESETPSDEGEEKTE